MVFPIHSLRGNYDNAAHSNGNHAADSEFACDRPHDSEQFYKFCLANRNLCIERTASGDVIIKVRQLDWLRGLVPDFIKTQPSSLPQ